MSVRFKFRSSRDYDSVHIGDRPSISVRDLKSSIVQSKKLNLCQDFDLLFSDPISGQEYLDEDFQIPRGSSVIIKRVPAGARFGSCKVFATSDANMSKFSQHNAETINFDDFGSELCPVPEGKLSCNIENRFSIEDEKIHFDVKRFSEQPVVECHKFERSGISEAMPQGQIVPETKSKPDIELNAKLSAFPAMQPADFPSALKCPLCDTFFKEAVLIPCCQHSFCEKCIRHALLEKKRCPKCFSTKCKVEDLLPNLSLRHATERSLKSQNVINDSENDIHRYPPDEESGIQAKDVSCAVSVLQRGAELPPPFVTERGSNQVHAELIGGTGSHVNGNHLLHLLKDNISKLPVQDLECCNDFQGENQPIIEEAESNIKKKRALWINTSDAENIYVDMARLKKGDRACYKCGSPGHFRRDCPAVSSPHPILQRGNVVFPGAMSGYVSPYWNGPPFPPIRPFANPYDLSGMMPFNATVIPTAPFHVPTYMPSMFGGSPAFGGFTMTGGIPAAMKNNLDHHLYLSELDGQDYDEKHHNACENVRRERSSRTTDEDAYSDAERHDGSSRVAGQYPKPYHHSGRPRSEVDDMPSISSWYSWEKHKHGRRSSKRCIDRREHCDSDSSWTDSKRKIVKRDAQKKHYHHSESSPEPNHSTDRKKKRRDKHSEHKAKPAQEELIHDRWQMASRPDEERQEYHYDKRKKGLLKQAWFLR